MWTPEYGGLHELVYHAPDGSENRTASFYVGLKSDFPVKTGGAAVWLDESTTGPYGGVSFSSGAIPASETTWMEIVVPPEGRVSFRWKASTESYGGEVFDYAYVSLDGEPLGALGRSGGRNVLSGLAIGGETDWVLGTVDVFGDAPHTIRWTYVKDGFDDSDACEDRVQVADIAFDLFSCVSQVSFSLGDGVGTAPAPLSEIVHTIVDLPLASGFSREKYSFAGWSDGTATYPEGSAYEIPVTDVELVATWSAKVLRAPSITSEDATNGCVTVNESVTINIEADSGATILYTLDGSDPATFGVPYTGPFELDSVSVMVKAVAVHNGFFSSDVATFSCRRRSFGPVECLNLGQDVRFDSFGGNTEWTRVLDTDSHDGDAAYRSGEISDGESSSLAVAVYGPGNVSFWWKTSSEKIHGQKRDFVSFTVDGYERAWLGGENDWTNRSFRIRGAGEHMLVWTYAKDETGAAGDDCAWLDEVSWQADSVIPEMGDADEAAISNAVLAVGFADPSVCAAIGGSAAEYEAFRTWAACVTNVAGTAIAGEATVIANANAVAAYLLGAERLFSNSPYVTFVEANTNGDGGNGVSEMVVGVAVRDGEETVRCSAEKMAALFEATSDLGDWSGAAKLIPLVTVEDDVGDIARFTVVFGDGTARKAFLRIRKE